MGLGCLLIELASCWMQGERAKAFDVPLIPAQPPNVMKCAGNNYVCCNCTVSHRAAAQDANSTVLLGLFSVAAAIPLFVLVCAKQICASAHRS
jgi:hypothetical protein